MSWAEITEQEEMSTRSANFLWQQKRCWISKSYFSRCNTTKVAGVNKWRVWHGQSFSSHIWWLQSQCSFCFQQHWFFVLGYTLISNNVWVTKCPGDFVTHRICKLDMVPWQKLGQDCLMDSNYCGLIPMVLPHKRYTIM